MENVAHSLRKNRGQAILELLIVLAAILLLWNILLPAGKVALTRTKKELLSKE